VAAYVGITGLVVLVAMLGLIATRPASLRIERSAPVSAPGDVVFSIINDLHQWDKWSPYDKLDPGMKKTFEGPSTGPGASYAWNGNDKVGEGRMTILESKADELVSMKLEFSRPFACTNHVRFELVPAQAGTRVSWIMEGKNSFIGKAIGLFMDMDAMVGKDFEQGLANLNTVAQAETQKLRQVAQGAAAAAENPAAVTPPGS